MMAIVSRMYIGPRSGSNGASDEVHHAKAHIEVDEHRNIAHALADVVEAGRDRDHPIEIRRGVDVIEDVELAHGAILLPLR